MKIAYVGNFSLDFTTETHLAKTLEKLGHEVVRIQETPTRTNDFWTNEVFGCDMFLFTRTWGRMVTLGDLATIKQHGIPSVSYHLDLYVGLQRVEAIDQDPFWRTDYVFTADGDPESQKFFEGKGINHHWLMPAVYEDECTMLKPNDDQALQGDVIFVGGGAEYGHPEWSYRHDLVKFLGETYGNRYRKYGHPQRLVRGNDLNQLYANSKIAIGDSVNIGWNHQNYVSDRLFESIGRGAFTIFPYIKGVSELFPDSLKDIWYHYGDFEGLKTRIDYYLTHDEERERIRGAGFEFVKTHHTYTQRLQELLTIVMGEAAPEAKEGLKTADIPLNGLELAEARIARQGEIIDELLKVLKEYDPELHKRLVTNSQINDWYLIRAGAK